MFKIKQYFISNDFFEKGYPKGKGPCHCSSKCCHRGVWLDVRDSASLLSKKESIKNHMDESQPKNDEQWFDNSVIDDTDFPSGKATGTTVYNDKCAFLDNWGRCSIQLAAVAAGEHKWAWKPSYCVLFPVDVSDNVIWFNPMLQDDQACCTISSSFETPLFVACEGELTYLVGADGYAVLQEHYASLQQTQSDAA